MLLTEIPHTLFTAIVSVLNRKLLSVGASATGCYTIALTAFMVLPAFSITVIAQEYSYVHYDVKDGLAGSTVYDACQDKDGFIWFATEAGVSRFDGTRFKNYSTADGLPETEVMKLFADTRGRVWMAPFKNAICYYYKGKIFTQENDKQLKKIRLSLPIVGFYEDQLQDIVMITGGINKEAFILKNGDSVKSFLSPGGLFLKSQIILIPKDLSFHITIRYIP